MDVIVNFTNYIYIDNCAGENLFLSWCKMHPYLIMYILYIQKGRDNYNYYTV